LEAVSGVEDVSVSLSTNMAKVTYLTNSTTKESLREAIENVGYEVAEEHVLDTEEGEISEDRLERLLHQQERQVTARKQAFLWSLAGTCPILIMTMILPHLPHEAGLEKVLHKEVRIGHFKVLLEALILWILCTPIQFGSGWSFFKTSYLNLKQGVMGMDVLVVVGGIIPDNDIPLLKEIGVAEVFTPGSSLPTISEWLEKALDNRERAAE
jgi:cation transport ATPase